MLLAARGGRARARRCRELPLLSEAERHQVLVEWNDTAAPHPRDALRPRAVRGPGRARRPDAVAVVFGGRAADLRASSTRGANQLAHRLRAPGRRARGAGRPLPGALARAGGRPARACSRPAAPTCRSTPPTRASGWPSCWRTPARRCCSPRRTCRPRCPRWPARAACCSTREAALLRATAARPPRHAVDARQPRLRDLHLGLDRPAQGRGGRRTAACVNLVAGRGRPSASGPAAGVLAVRLAQLRRLGLRALRAAAAAAAPVVPAPATSCCPAAAAAAPLLSVTQAITTRAAPPMLALVPPERRCRGLRDGHLGGEALPARAASQRLGRRPAAAAQRLRPDRGHASAATWRPCAPTGAAACRSAGRSPTRALYVLDARAAAGAGGRAGRAVHRRRGPGARLPAAGRS